VSVDKVRVLISVLLWALTSELPRLCASGVIGDHYPRRKATLR